MVPTWQLHEAAAAVVVVGAAAAVVVDYCADFDWVRSTLSYCKARWHKAHGFADVSLRHQGDH